jgi:hypothetical protein
MTAQFDAAVSALERVLVTPETICPKPSGVTNATPERRRGANCDYALYLFDPPWLRTVFHITDGL